MLRKVVTLPAGHPIVADHAGMSLRLCTPVSINVSYVPSMGPEPLLLDIPDQCCAEWSSRFMPASGNKPEVGITRKDDLRKDTGGERWMFETPLKQGGFSHSWVV